ncbi:DUF2860 domain-containing protein [Rhodobacteraceae bacterium CH30]|nr:DUF2860 domain-containing protein [Rhodobacteraceae bacterium CH30]
MSGRNKNLILTLCRQGAERFLRKRDTSMKKIALASVALLLTGAASAAINPIPTTNGFSGALSIGVASSDVSSNMYKGDDNGRINHLGAPDSHGETDPLLMLDLRYTLADSRTQFVLGNQVHDALRLDYTQQLGVRQEIGNNGIVSAGLVFSGFGSKDVWANPYALGTEREETKRKSTGMRLGWEGILGSNFSADITRRKVELDEERSPSSLLNRNGNTTRFNLSYDWEFAPGHFLAPGIVLGKHDLDGRAMSNDSTGFKLDYGYNTGLYTLTANLYLGEQKYDAINPLFGKKADSSDFVIGANLLRHQLFGYKNVSGFVNAAYGKSDSDINFYDAEVKRVGAGVMYKF